MRESNLLNLFDQKRSKIITSGSKDVRKDCQNKKIKQSNIGTFGILASKIQTNLEQIDLTDGLIHHSLSDAIIVSYP
jgi:hypothetical protein